MSDWRLKTDLKRKCKQEEAKQDVKVICNELFFPLLNLSFLTVNVFYNACDGSVSVVSVSLTLLYILEEKKDLTVLTTHRQWL